jgi:hypothetical protein
MKMEHKTIIEKWMMDSVQSGGITRHDELHIDRIDSAWKASSTWISASLEVLELATSIANSARYRDLSVVLALSLQTRLRKTGVDFASAKELGKRLGHTPPSLYIFPQGKEPWIHSGSEGLSVQKIDVGIFSPSSTPKQCFYMEFKGLGGDGYYRSLFLKG